MYYQCFTFFIYAWDYKVEIAQKKSTEGKWTWLLQTEKDDIYIMQNTMFKGGGVAAGGKK